MSSSVNRGSVWPAPTKRASGPSSPWALCPRISVPYTNNSTRGMDALNFGVFPR
jgi:hypothetical protein